MEKYLHENMWVLIKSASHCFSKCDTISNVSAQNDFCYGAENGPYGHTPPSFQYIWIRCFFNGLDGFRWYLDKTDFEVMDLNSNFHMVTSMCSGKLAPIFEGNFFWKEDLAAYSKFLLWKMLVPKCCVRVKCQALPNRKKKKKNNNKRVQH